MERKRSPINGQPVPVGRLFKPGDEQRQRASRGGRASAETRARYKRLKEELEMLLASEYVDPDGNKMTHQKAISVALIQKAIDGDVRAYALIRDTIGQKPAENVTISQPDFSLLDSIMEELTDK